MTIEIGIECGGRQSIGYLATSFTSGVSINKSTASPILTITPTLYTTRTIDTTVNVVVSGGHSDKEDYGVGKHYTLSCTGATITNTAYNQTTVSCTIPAGSTTKAITLTIVNNPVYEYDRTITISAALFGAPKTFVIHDDKALSSYVYNAVTDVGLVPNSEASASANRTALQNFHQTIRGLSGWDATTHQAIIYFPNGDYYFEHDIRLWPGIRHVGQSASGVTLRRPSVNWYIENGFPVANGGYYYYPMFRYMATGSSTYIWNDTSDTKATGFENICFDGSYDSFWAYDPDYSYTTFEQSPMLEYAVASSSTLQGRLTFILENVKFQSNITSHYAAKDNTVSSVCNVDLGGVPLGKGDFSFVGGGTVFSGKWITSTQNHQVDFEQNNAYGSHAANGSIDVYLENSTLGELQIGCALVHGTQAIGFKNCHTRGLGIIAPSADITFEDCVVDCDEYRTLEGQDFREVKSFTATNTIFNLSVPATGTYQGLSWRANYKQHQTWTFNSCTFNKIGDWGSKKCCAFSAESIYINRYDESTYPYAELVLTDCIFNNVDYVVYTGNGGGKITITRPTLNNCDNFLALYGNASTGANYTVSVVDATKDTITLASSAGDYTCGYLTTTGTLPSPIVAWAISHKTYHLWKLRDTFNLAAVNYTTNTITLSKDLGDNTPVVIDSTYQPPTGIVIGTTYYTKRISATEFQLAATSGGAAIDLSAPSIETAGTYTIRVTSNVYQVYETFSGTPIDLTSAGSGTITFTTIKDFFYDVTVENPTINGTLTSYIYDRRDASTADPRNIIRHVSTSIDAAEANNIAANASVRGNSYYGKRTINGTGSPGTSLTGLPADEYAQNSVVTYIVNRATNETFLPAAVNTTTNAIAMVNDYGSATRVWLDSTGTLPAPLRKNYLYFTIRDDATHFGLSLTAGGSRIDLTDQGTGTHSIYNATNTNAGYQKTDTTYVNTTWTAV